MYKNLAIATAFLSIVGLAHAEGSKVDTQRSEAQSQSEQAQSQYHQQQELSDIEAQARSRLANQPANQTQLTREQLSEISNDDTIVEPFNLSAEQLEDMAIRNQAGKQVAEVEDVLVDADGQVRAISAEIGGFMGIGDREVIVALDKLTRQGDSLITSLSEAELKKCEEWED